MQILGYVIFQEAIILNNNLIDLSALELAPLLETKSISPLELTKEVLNQAEQSQSKINAYMDIYREDALQAARKAEQEILSGHFRGIYHGIPMAIKDNLYVQDKITTMSSKIHKDFIPTYDATVVKKLHKAGVVLTGKLSMHEYASGVTNDNPHYGAVRNPWDLDKIPGGSSGGSGAAIAIGSSVASLGTDTAGSVRIPASACGIVGLKPTYGLVSKHGSFPLSWSLDHVGPMTKTIKDAAGLLEIIAGFDPNDPASVNVPKTDYLSKVTGDVKDLVIGIDEDYFFHQIDNDINQLVQASIQSLVEQGAKVEIVKIPSLQYAEWAELISFAAEASAIHHTNLQNRPDDFGDDIRLFFELGALPSAVDYLQAQQVRRQLKKDFQKVFEKVDILISPTLPIEPTTIGDHFANLNGTQVDAITNIIRLTGPANLTGIPALSLPCGFKGNLPIGLQIMGPAFGEATILNAGFAIEQTKPLQGRKPNPFVQAN